MINECSVAAFRLPQGFFRKPAIGDVSCDPLNGKGLAFSVNDTAFRFHPERAAVLSSQFVFDRPALETCSQDLFEVFEGRTQVILIQD